jgi:DNA-binding protein H-NS
MNGDAFESMSLDELWKLHEQVTSTLARRVAQQKAMLEEQLEEQLRGLKINNAVLPKYQDPKIIPFRTSRGKQPRWVHAQLKAY